MTTAQAKTLITPDTVRTASLYPLATLEERTAGTARVLVTRYWPRGLKRERIDVWWRDAAPTPDMLKLYRKDFWDWETFARTYTGLLRMTELHIRNAAHMRLILHGAITLLCVEHCPRDGHDESDIRCHRRLLRELLLSESEGSQP